MFQTIRRHWPEYLIEAACLGAFMLSACTFASILSYPDSPAHMWLMAGLLRRIVMGAAMALTALAIIYSPWGKRSGAHINPAVTLTFWRLGKIAPWDTFFYLSSQFLGGISGVLVARALLGAWVAHPAVNYAITTPGKYGDVLAFIAEALISFLLMSVILRVSNSQSLAQYTGVFAALLLAMFIIFEAPLSGMSMNPARTLGSALSAHVWTALWIYFTAPPLGMLLAAEIYVRMHGAGSVLCAKLHHQNAHRCIFRCGYAPRAASAAS